MLKKGLIHVYTGNGKGKTTSSIGQAVRAKGQGLKVCFVYFHKDADRNKSGEVKVLKKIGIDVYCFAKKHPYMSKKTSLSCIRFQCRKTLDFIHNALFKKRYDLMVLDEVNIAIRDGFIDENELLDLLTNKPKGLEVVLTGRGASRRIIKQAHLVSEIKKIKHPYDSGIKMRKGIEY